MADDHCDKLERQLQLRHHHRRHCSAQIVSCEFGDRESISPQAQMLIDQRGVEGSAGFVFEQDVLVEVWSEDGYRQPQYGRDAGFLVFRSFCGQGPKQSAFVVLRKLTGSHTGDFAAARAEAKL
jgi:hypothetical protein